MSERTTDDIGATVRKLREERGMRIRELAGTARVSEETIRLVENGLRRAKGATYGRIAQGLGVSLDQLLTEDDVNGGEAA